MKMLSIFSVGDKIGGYCNGFFGRDDYEDKTCVMVTPMYAVFQYDDGRGTLLNYQDELEDVAKGADWKHSGDENYKY